MANEKRLVDVNPLMKDGWHLVKTGKSNVFIASMSLADVQTVEAVEVVRCEKCNHAVWDEEYEMWKCVESAEYDEESGAWFGFCEYHDGDFFCADGKRKDGDGNG